MEEKDEKKSNFALEQGKRKAMLSMRNQRGKELMAEMNRRLSVQGGKGSSRGKSKRTSASKRVSEVKDSGVVDASSMPLSVGGSGRDKCAVFSVSASGSVNGAVMAYEPLVDEPDDAPMRIDYLDVYALRIIDMVQSGVLHQAMLPNNELCILYRYFSRNNPVIARILDLHTDIVMSKVKVNPPPDLPEIAKDYMMSFYEKILDRCNFIELTRNAVYNYFVYGNTDILVSDTFEGKRELRMPEGNEVRTVNRNEDELREIEARYQLDPKSVDVQTRIEYLRSKFGSGFEEDYMGPKSMRIVNFWEIEEVCENKDIGFKQIRILPSPSLRALSDEGVTIKEMMEIGYSKGFLENVMGQSLVPSDVFLCPQSILLDTGHELGKAFILQFDRSDNTSALHRLLNECLAWDAAYKALRIRIKQIGKIGRIVTAEELSQAQLDELRGEVQTMLENPDYAIVANYNINWNEVNTSLKDELDNLINSTDKLKDMLASALGMPESLISGDSSYSGDSVKLDLINQTYFSIKANLANAFNRGLLQPIALRKGFFGIDEWGEKKLYAPSLTLSRVSLRDSTVFDLCFQLYQKGSCPASLIYELLGLSPEEVKRGVHDEAFTLLDPNMNDLLSDLISQGSSDIYSTTDVKDKLIKNLQLKEQNLEDKEDADLDDDAW